MRKQMKTYVGVGTFSKRNAHDISVTQTEVRKLDYIEGRLKELEGKQQ